MTGKPIKLLLVEDEHAHAAAIQRAFEKAGLPVIINIADSLADFHGMSVENPPDIAVMDLNLPDGCAIDALIHPPETGNFPILLMTSFGNENIAVEAIKAGALDYIVKSPEAFFEMPHTVERALREWNLIRERKLVQDELVEATRRLRLATESGQLGIWDYDLVRDMIIWNDRMYEIYGVSQDTFSISFTGWEKLLHPEDLDQVLDSLRNAIDYDTDYSLEYRVVRPDETIKFVRSNALVVRDNGGKPIRMIGMDQDMTERKQLEGQLLQSQKMEAIGQLAGGIAHDLNNILMVIYGYCSTLQFKLGENSPVSHDLDNIFTAAERAANLTRSLLAFSRKQIMTPKTVDLNHIVMDISKILTRIIGEDIQIRITSTGEPLMVNVDCGQIEQVLMNLAANARDAMPDGGILTIATGFGEIDEEFINSRGFGSPGGYASIVVSDTGKGMDFEVTKKIFEPFFTTKEVGKGTGLGLAIAYGVVKQHNGFIDVTSEPGKGTEFTIYLPMLSMEEKIRNVNNSEKGTEAPHAGNETVLVVEDDPSIRMLAESYLAKLGYRVILANDGQDAVEKFKANIGLIDITIMDMVMPIKSGREAFDEIRSLYPDAKILFMSGYCTDLLHNRGFLDIDEEVIIKPVQPVTLVKKIREALDRDQAIDMAQFRNTQINKGMDL
jgi:PAS domain S-box-containing protein